MELRELGVRRRIISVKFIDEGEVIDCLSNCFATPISAGRVEIAGPQSREVRT